MSEMEEWNGIISIVSTEPEAIYQAIKELLRVLSDFLKDVVGAIASHSSRERQEHKPINHRIPRQLMLDKRSKIHRCRNAI